MPKTNVIFVDEHNSSKQNGIGTYRDILLPLLGENKNINLTLVSFNSDCDDMDICRHRYGVEYALPFVAGGDWRGNGSVIWPLLRQYIPDTDRTIFMFNHSPCAGNMEAVKRLFPQSKIIFVIHDQGWCASLYGDARILSAIERGEHPDAVPENIWNHVHGYCCMENDIYRIADAVVCLSESTQTYLREIYNVPEEKIHLIHNGYHADRKGFSPKASARRKLGLLPEDELLVFVARAAPHKGIRAMLGAMAKIREKHPHMRCALVGAPQGFINHWDLGNKLASNLILPGMLTQMELRMWYSAADVGVLSSYTEQCSYAALEMMNAGITIVSSDGNGLRDMFTNGKDAFVAHIESLDDYENYTTALAREIESALTAAADSRRKMSASARNLMRTKYSALRMYDHYAALFGRLTDVG